MRAAVAALFPETSTSSREQHEAPEPGVVRRPMRRVQKTSMAPVSALPAEVQEQYLKRMEVLLKAEVYSISAVSALIRDNNMDEGARLFKSVKGGNGGVFRCRGCKEFSVSYYRASKDKPFNFSKARCMPIHGSLQSDGETFLPCGHTEHITDASQLESLSTRGKVRRRKPKAPSTISIPRKPLDILVIGFGPFGQFLSQTFIKKHSVIACNATDESNAAMAMNCDYMSLENLVSCTIIDCDVILLAVSIISFEEVLSKIPKDMLRGKLVLDVLSVKVHARDTMLSLLPTDCDVLCTHPMFGPESGKYSWDGLNFMFEKVRVSDELRCETFLSIFRNKGCKMIQMTCEEHDVLAARSQFITHFVGRVLGEMELSPTPIDTKSFQSLLEVIDTTKRNSFDLFRGLYVFNTDAEEEIVRLQEAIEKVHNQLKAA